MTDNTTSNTGNTQKSFYEKFSFQINLLIAVCVLYVLGMGGCISKDTWKYMIPGQRQQMREQRMKEAQQRIEEGRLRYEGKALDGKLLSYPNYQSRKESEK